MDGQLNTIEYFVHHEDVRRGRAGWAVRDLDPQLSDFLWDRLRLAGKTWFGNVKSGLYLVRTDGAGADHKARSGESPVTLTGTAGELMLIAFGRSEVEVEVAGDDDAVDAFMAARLHVTEDVHPDE